MKNFFKYFLKNYLKLFSKIAIFIHRPTVIGIAGSTNKTFVKESIENFLDELGKDYKSHDKSFNTDIGISLAILDLPSGYNKYKDWLPAIYKAPIAIFKKIPKFLIVEYGVSDKKDMKFLLSIVKPNIGILTDISQRYIESFKDMDYLEKEYTYFAKSIKDKGLLIINLDNSRLRQILNKIPANIPVKSFSIEGQADISASGINKNDRGQTFKVGNDILEIERFGEHHIYAFLAGCLVKEYVAQKK